MAEKTPQSSLSPPFGLELMAERRERVRVRGYHKEWQSLLTEHLQKSIKPLIVILGPTASGKTAFSIEVAKWIGKQPPPLGGMVRERGSKAFLYPLSLTLSPGEREFRVEIINADSRQLYKYMDIGTAKITEGEKEGIPHHLFSVLDPKEKVTVDWYKKAAEKAIDGVLARGSVPILVGGSMLYISAVTDGYVFTGRGGKDVAPIPYDLLIFGRQWPRSELVQRIEERTAKLLGEPPSPTAVGEGMGERGNWVTEVTWLLQNGYTIQDPGMKSHGYRKIAEWILCGKKKEKLQELEEQINAVIRQYAKRQMTWWKGDERIHWIPCNSPPPSKTSFVQPKSTSKLSRVSAFEQ